MEVGREVPEVYRWLAKDAADVRVLELPMSTERREREAWDVAQYRQVYYTTYHWKRTVNGLSGYLPPGYAELQDRMAKFPAPESLRLLGLIPIDRVVVHRTLYATPIPRSLFEKPGFRVLYDTDEALVAEVHQEGGAVERRFDPQLELLSEPSPDKPLAVRVRWNRNLPEFVYPPARVQIRVWTGYNLDRDQTLELRDWLVTPDPKDYRIPIESGASSVTLGLTVDQKNRLEKSWSFARPGSTR